MLKLKFALRMKDYAFIGVQIIVFLHWILVDTIQIIALSVDVCTLALIF